MFIELFRDDYFVWLRENSSVREEDNGWFELVTPYLDRYNDNVVVYAKQEKGVITINDGGETLWGFKERHSYLKAVENILFMQGIELRAKELTVECNKGNFVQKLHNLVSAMIEINFINYDELN